MVLIAVSLGVFFSAFYHYQGLLGNEVKLASSVAEVTSVFTSAPIYDEPSFVSGGWGITEERSVIFMFILAGFLSFSAAITAVVARLKKGSYQSFVPIVLCSICVISSIAYTAYWYSLDTYA
jgi:hypothetical protein